jgi:hypothetical protein
LTRGTPVNGSNLLIIDGEFVEINKGTARVWIFQGRSISST